MNPLPPPQGSRPFGSPASLREQTDGLLANLTPQATVLSPDRRRSMTFDREGRWLFYFCDGRTYKRSLASEVHLRFRQGTRRRRHLPEEQALQVFEEIYQLAQEIHGISQGEVRRRLVEEILPWTPRRLAAEKARFELAYRPVSILPPDQYLAVVLQATQGCTWNDCTFCNFYMDRPFRIREASEFAAHVAAVQQLLGEGLRLRRDVFLADGNALALSNRRLLPLLEIASEVFPGRRFNGFVDLFSGERRSVDDWRELQRQGLERVHVGMETGLDELLEFVNKPGSARELAEFVAELKSVDLQISLIVMIGLGGREFCHRHREASEKLLLNLPLDRRDQIYLSPFVEHSGSTYQQRRRAANLTPMNENEVVEEMAQMASKLRREGLRVSRYDIREFVY